MCALLPPLPSLKGRGEGICIDNDTVVSRLAIPPFLNLFSSEGKFEYKGCDDTEHRGQRLEQGPYFTSSPD
jgi:hypothetical protein